MLQNIVIDASVILTFQLSNNTDLVQKCIPYFLGNTIGQKSGSKNQKYRLIAPELLKIEVANGLRFSLSNESERLNYFNAFRKLNIKYIETDFQLLEFAISRSELVNDTVYDALYHVTAQAHDAEYVTCDTSYYKKAKLLGNIQHLS